MFLDFGLRFNLRQKKIDKPTIIYAVFMWNGVQHKVNTLLKVYPSHWDSKSQSATVSNRLTELDNWNNRIINEKISSIIERYRCLSQIDDPDTKFIFNGKPLNPDLTSAEAGLSNNSTIFALNKNINKKK